METQRGMDRFQFPDLSADDLLASTDVGRRIPEAADEDAPDILPLLDDISSPGGTGVRLPATPTICLPEARNHGYHFSSSGRRWDTASPASTSGI